MKELASHHRRFGLSRLHYLLKREGRVRSKDRTERIYRKLSLKLSKRRRKKMLSMVRVPFEKAQKPNEICSFDFVSDQVEKWRRYYNEKRPNSSIGNKTPIEFEKQFNK